MSLKKPPKPWQRVFPWVGMLILTIGLFQLSATVAQGKFDFRSGFGLLALLGGGAGLIQKGSGARWPFLIGAVGATFLLFLSFGR